MNTTKQIKEKLINLVKEGNKILIENQKVLDQWMVEADEARRAGKDTKEIDERYERLTNAAFKTHDVIYNSYYYTIHNLFSNEIIETVNEAIGYNFMSQEFIEKLFN